MTLQLPAYESPYAVTSAMLEAYQKTGWAFCPGTATEEEVKAYLTAVDAVVSEYARHYLPMEQRNTYGKAFIQVSNIWQIAPELAPYTLSKRFARIAAALLGAERVRIYHDQALFKEPGGGHTPWHQDGYYWPVPQEKTVTMWMPLVDVPAEVGTMSFADGSHLDGIISTEMGISDQSEAFYEGFVMGRRYKVSTAGAMKAGDATFHSGLTLHRAPGNPTSHMRSVMTVIYVADGSVVQQPQNEAQVGDLAGWLPGLKPGDLISSPLNPIV
jgi:ectoine hydroxylase-related dioxygenase (phytanoyl-CoA dioxygenase family)